MLLVSETAMLSILPFLVLSKKPFNRRNSRSTPIFDHSL